MKIGTTLVVKVIDYNTNELITETSGKSCDFVIPRSGEFIELTTTKKDGPSVNVYRVEKVGHQYNNSYRNTVLILVRKDEG